LRTRTAPLLQVGGLLVLIATVLLTNVGASCCVGTGCDEISPDAVKSFSKNGISFDYPARWAIADRAAVSSGANSLWTDAVGIDDDNNVVFSAYQLKRAVTPEDFTNGALDEEIRESLSAATTVDKPNQAGTYAGLQSLTYTGSTTDAGKTSNHRWVFVFKGDVQYLFNCTWLDAKASDVTSGCDKILATLKTR
jgi:hypothetical protein